MTDFGKPLREYMLEETTGEFPGIKRHGFGAVVAVIAVGKLNGLLGNVDQSLIGNGHAMGIPTEIFEDFMRTGKRQLSEDIKRFTLSLLH